MIESYKLFLKSNYQKNSSDVIGLITKARDELNAELKALEQAYLEYRQKNPAYSADSTGHTFVARRLDQWDQTLNQFSARSLQLQSQLELGKKMSREGVDPANIANALSQVGMIGGNPPAGSPACHEPRANTRRPTMGHTSASPRNLPRLSLAARWPSCIWNTSSASIKTPARPGKFRIVRSRRRFLDDPVVVDLKSEIRYGL